MSLVISDVYGPADSVTGSPVDPRGAPSCDTADNLLVNCGFETGDFTGWVTQDVTGPFLPLTVAGPGSPGFGFFTSAPTEGVVSALHGFDGEGPGTIEIGQQLTLPSGAGSVLEFDYRGAWDIQTFAPPGALSRTFSVNIEPAGGGAALESIEILVAEGNTINLDTGPQTETIDLTDFAGQTVLINFVWDVPEFLTGPAFFELDNVSVVQGLPSSQPVPALDGVGLVLLAAILAAGSWLALRNKRKA